MTIYWCVAMSAAPITDISEAITGTFDPSSYNVCLCIFVYSCSFEGTKEELKTHLEQCKFEGLKVSR